MNIRSHYWQLYSSNTAWNDQSGMALINLQTAQSCINAIIQEVAQRITTPIPHDLRVYVLEKSFFFSESA